MSIFVRIRSEQSASAANNNATEYVENTKKNAETQIVYGILSAMRAGSFLRLHRIFNVLFYLFIFFTSISSIKIQCQSVLCVHADCGWMAFVCSVGYCTICFAPHVSVCVHFVFHYHGILLANTGGEKTEREREGKWQRKIFHLPLKINLNFIS